MKCLGSRFLVEGAEKQQGYSIAKLRLNEKDSSFQNASYCRSVGKSYHSASSHVIIPTFTRERIPTSRGHTQAYMYRGRLSIWAKLGRCPVFD